MIAIEDLFLQLKASGFDPSVEEIADAIWLARQLPTSTNAEPVSATPSPIESAVGSQPDTPNLPRSSEQSQPAGKPETATRPSSEKEGLQAGTDVSEEFAQLYRGLNSLAGARSAMAFRAPGVSALPESRDLARVLRRTFSRTKALRSPVFDEEETVRRIVEERLWAPAFSPSRGTRMRLLLAVDVSPTMAIWDSTLKDFQRLLERHAGFRDVRRWNLDLDKNPIELIPGRQPSLGHRRTGELKDPSGDSVILVVSDCMHEAWGDDSLSSVLRDWMDSGCVALLQVFPRRMWPRTMAGVPQLSCLTSGQSNRNKTLRPATRSVNLQRPTPYALPIFSFDAPSLATWSHFVAGHGRVELDCVDAGPQEISYADKEDAWADDEDALAGELDPQQLVRRFGINASAPARTLASYFATVPLSLPVMRLVQQVMLPASRHVHLAEFLLSGLIAPVDPAGEPRSSDDIAYEFVHPEIRDLLLEGTTAKQARQTIDSVIASVSDFVERQSGRAKNFSAQLADPTGKGSLSIAEDSRPFARVTAQVLRRYGGKYTELADRLDNLIVARTWTSTTFAPRVLVAGTGQYEPPREVALPAALLGEQLAENGSHLVVGGWPGVDAIVAQSFVEKAGSLNVDAGSRVIQVVEQGRDIYYKIEGARTEFREDWDYGSVEQADILVMVGGEGGTRRLFETAVSRNKPVISLAASGGDAGFSAAAAQNTLKYGAKTSRWLSFSTESDASARLVIDGAIDLIRLSFNSELEHEYLEYLRAMQSATQTTEPKSDELNQYRFVLSDITGEKFDQQKAPDDIIAAVTAGATLLEKHARLHPRWLALEFLELLSLLSDAAHNPRILSAIVLAFVRAGTFGELRRITDVLSVTDDDLLTLLSGKALPWIAGMVSAALHASGQASLDQDGALRAWRYGSDEPEFGQSLPNWGATDWGLVVGLDDYDTLAPAAGCADAALKFAEWLTSERGGNLPVHQIRVLTGRVTSDMISEAIGWLSNANDPFPAMAPGIGHRIYVYVAGHSVGSPSRGGYQFFASDARANTSSGLIDLEASLKDRVPYRQLVGFFSSTGQYETEAVVPKLDIVPRPDEPLLREILIVKSVTNDPVELVSNIIDGLSGLAVDQTGNVTAESMSNYLTGSGVRFRSSPRQQSTAYVTNSFTVIPAERISPQQASPTVATVRSRKRSDDRLALRFDVLGNDCRLTVQSFREGTTAFNEFRGIFPVERLLNLASIWRKSRSFSPLDSRQNLAREIGIELFRIVFGPVGSMSLLENSFRQAAQDNRRLVVELHLPDELTTVPFEAFYDPEHNGFMTIWSECAIVRVPSIMRRHTPPINSDPTGELRIAVFGYPSTINFDAQRLGLLRAFAEQGGRARLDWVPDPRRLTDTSRAYNVWHCSISDNTTPEKLAHVLRQVAPPQLLIIEAATQVDLSTILSYSFSPSLLLLDNMEDLKALSFLESFYTKLTEGDQIQWAVNYAQRADWHRGNNTEPLFPRLYLNGDGEIL